MKDKIATALFVLLALFFFFGYYGTAYLKYRDICSNYQKTVYIP